MKWWTAACIIVRRCDVEQLPIARMKHVSCASTFNSCLQKASIPSSKRTGGAAWLETISYHFRRRYRAEVAGVPFSGWAPGFMNLSSSIGTFC
jgi:hypothetical protein